MCKEVKSKLSVRKMAKKVGKIDSEFLAGWSIVKGIS
jgi:hypothetical protein